MFPLNPVLTLFLMFVLLSFATDVFFYTALNELNKISKYRYHHCQISGCYWIPKSKVSVLELKIFGQRIVNRNVDSFTERSEI